MTMPSEPAPPSGAAPEPESPEEQDQNLSEEAADFITSQVLDKGADFFGG
jgi:hypothetical protein